MRVREEREDGASGHTNLEALSESEVSFFKRTLHPVHEVTHVIIRTAEQRKGTDHGQIFMCLKHT